jgi:DNA-binding NarL/FixJ family response regulator
VEVAGFRPEVVLVDVQMPDSTPAELCARMRAAASSRMQVLLFSGMPDAALAELANQVGADGSLSKERGPDGIVDEVTKAYRKVRG